jgi:mono/diheme cytochrome c family protein
MQKMNRPNKKWLILALGLIVVGVLSWVISQAARDRGAPVDFSTEVKPILNKNCISCHGGVKAKGGFSLLFEEEAFRETESGKPAIIKGNPDASEMIRRLTLDDPEERMPFEHDPLSPKDIATLRRWIKQGAPWGDHWAYLPVKQPTETKSIDTHIKEELDKMGLTGSARADAAVLVRRVGLDLIGLYPEKAWADKFIKADGSPAAYEELVDSLLASPRFGERWASMWLDLARYADTKGYESDGHRHAWPYRDWVIKAFNKDMPYDQFIKEQMAGDLLPNPTDDQLIATGFHRNSMTNDEGGTDNEEFRVAAVMDRINTSWEAIMSTTFSCVQCHSHPYDPFKHDEYYKFLAYFNNTRDEDVPGEYPWLRQLTPEMEKELDWVMEWVEEKGERKGEKGEGVGEKGGWVKEMVKFYQPAVNSTTADSLENAVIGNMNYALIFKNNSSARFKNIDLNGAEQMIWQFYCNKPGGELTLRIDSPDGPVISKSSLAAKDQWRYESISFPKQEGVHDIYVQFERPAKATEKDDFTITFNWLSFVPAFPGKGKPGYDMAYQRYWKLLTQNVPGIPILYENPTSLHRTTRVFERGNRLTLGAEVNPAVPASLVKNMKMEQNELPSDRLELANWMTDPRNPLVSRTLVNRLWEQLFGAGLVETLEDMGTQGANPTHQALLDNLSWKLVHDYKWSIKKMLKEIVMSATYQQDSKVQPQHLEKDAANKYYARGPRLRLSAEQIRDQHLQVSGKLSDKMYGPGVMPWQPEGIWLSPYNGSKWVKSEGEDQYRRAVYTYWKRSSPYPSMMNFDGAQRVVCNARRIRTNTPLQALVTLNDSVYLDLARHFAGRMERKGEGREEMGGRGDKGEKGEMGGKGERGVEEMVKWGYRELLFREINQEQLSAMTSLYAKALREFEANPDQLAEFLGSENLEANNGIKHGKVRKTEYAQNAAHRASLIIVANAMLNMDEIIVKN